MVLDTVSLDDTARTFDWSLDNLGNWSAGTSSDSFIQQIDLNDDDDFGDPNEVILTHHATDMANEIDSITVNGGSTTLVYDIAGNLVFDGTLFYQYDGWNRLMQVNEAGDLTSTDFDSAGHLLDDPNLAPGDERMYCFYDGLGRLIRKNAPDAYFPGELYRETYFYDGVPRPPRGAS